MAACFCKKGLGPIHDIHEGLLYLSETITGLKQKIEKELVPHEIKDIMEDICKVLETIHEIVTHIEQDSSLAKEVLTKTSNDIQSLLKHFNVSV